MAGSTTVADAKTVVLLSFMDCAVGLIICTNALLFLVSTMHLAPESRREGSFDVGSRSTHECLGMFDKKTGSEVTDFPGKYVSLVTGKSYVGVSGECCMFMVTHMKGIIFSIENSLISLQETQSKNKWLMERCENMELMGDYGAIKRHWKGNST